LKILSACQSAGRIFFIFFHIKKEEEMTQTSNLSRRKFMLVSSAAIAAPFVMNITGMVQESKAAEGAKAAEIKPVYYINKNCIGCHFCFYSCPVSAIQWGDDKYEIDQKKCIKCGTCEKVCNISAATHR
jgi:Fe-S-cluster-containing hydrogenase component 2